MNLRHLAITCGVLLCAAGAASAQPGFYGRPGYPFGWFGYFPSRIDGNWSNGHSLYGPPVPTYGPTPGAFGGNDARLSNYRPGPAWARRSMPETPRSGLVVSRVIQVELVVPTADAVVHVDGALVEQSGLRRAFTLSNIEYDRWYRYPIAVTWNENGQQRKLEKTIDVQAGMSVRVDFSK